MSVKVFLLSTLCLFASGLIAQSLIKNDSFNSYFLYHNGLDTLHLQIPSSVQGTELFFSHFDNDIQIIDSIQLNGFGSKEIIFRLTYSETRSEHRGTFDVFVSESTSQYQVWDLDTGQLIFQATDFFSTETFGSQAYANPLNPTNYRTYRYDISFSENGEIRIENLRDSSNCEPDHAPGIYILVHRKYLPE